MTLGIDYAAGVSRAIELVGTPPITERLRTTIPGVREDVRREVSRIVVDRFRNAAPDASREKSIELIERGAAVVVAGQQPGLFGGPLLTSWKTATAIKLARALSRPDRPVVPVFWNASEDHDLSEADRFFQFTSDDSVRLRHSGVRGGGRALDRIRFEADDVERMTSWFDETIPPDLPRPGETFGENMTRIMSRTFAGTGLVIVEPGWFSALLAGHREEILERRLTLRAALIAGGAAVATAGYDRQLEEPPEDWTGLFVSDASGRHRLRAAAGKLIAGGRAFDSTKDMGTLSSSAALRSVAQRHLLPVLAQVAGPSEISYLVQSRPLFTALGLDFPTPWPRSGGIVLRKRDRARAALLGMGDAELSNHPTTWPRVDQAVPAAWDEAVAGLDAGLRELLVATDPELDRLLAPSRRAGRKLVKDLRRALTKSVKERNRPRARARHALEQSLWPRGRAQERVFSATALGCEATNVANALIDSIDPESRKRMIVEIAEE